MARTTTAISKDWLFAQLPHAADPSSSTYEQFRPVAQFPTNVHLDLLAHDLIPDPFFSKNELDVQWIGERDWVYKTSFEATVGKGKKVLVFEGLDTYATVVLNGEEVLKSDNMFTEYRVDVTSGLREGSNQLEISFESAFLRGKMIKEGLPDHHWGCWNGDSSRLAVRKAQYHYVSLFFVLKRERVGETVTDRLV